MTHQSQVYINQKIFPGNPPVTKVKQHSLNQTEAAGLSKCLETDAVSYLYSSIVSIGDATLGINKNLLTWATVKLYYATFYALRSLLAMDGICIFYVKHSPFVLNVQTAAIPKQVKGTTHKLILDTFKNSNTEPILVSQPIGLQEPLEWLMEKREEANYKNFWYQKGYT